MKNKFNIGDKVTIKKESPRKPIVFEISEVIISKSYVLYSYTEECIFRSKREYYDERDLELYTEPKPKVKKYLYASRYTSFNPIKIGRAFYTDDIDFLSSENTPHPEWYQRLDWSMIEVSE